MEPFVVTWRELLVGLIAVLGIYVAELLLLLRTGNRKGLRLWRRGAEAHSEHYAMSAMREELAALREQVGALRAELERLSPGPADEQQPTPYGKAIDLARHGRPAADVAADTGISRGEADLIVALYRRR
jgi:hypothetical protein